MQTAASQGQHLLWRTSEHQRICMATPMIEVCMHENIMAFKQGIFSEYECFCKRYSWCFIMTWIMHDTVPMTKYVGGASIGHVTSSAPHPGTCIRSWRVCSFIFHWINFVVFKIVY